MYVQHKKVQFALEGHRHYNTYSKFLNEKLQLKKWPKPLVG